MVEAKGWAKDGRMRRRSLPTLNRKVRRSLTGTHESGDDHSVGEDHSFQSGYNTCLRGGVEGRKAVSDWRRRF
jgi:hypothetical protein